VPPSAHRATARNPGRQLPCGFGEHPRLSP